jgi:N-dimethylarginine dimethylaminohydrolase
MRILKKVHALERKLAPTYSVATVQKQCYHLKQCYNRITTAITIPCRR